jgi:hypothetical protein
MRKSVEFVDLIMRAKGGKLPKGRVKLKINRRK